MRIFLVIHMLNISYRLSTERLRISEWRKRDEIGKNLDYLCLNREDNNKPSKPLFLHKGKVWRGNLCLDHVKAPKPHSSRCLCTVPIYWIAGRPQRTTLASKRWEKMLIETFLFLRRIEMKTLLSAYLHDCPRWSIDEARLSCALNKMCFVNGHRFCWVVKAWNKN